MNCEKTTAWKREQRAKEAVTCLQLRGHDPKSGLLLDLGCGQGYLAKYFLRLGIETVGADISRTLIKDAKKNVPSGSFVLADGVKLPFREEIFKTVVLNDVLEHVPYSLANPLLNEIRRTLKVDCKLYISVMNRYMIREGHTLIPFLTWLPKPCWDPVCRLVKKRHYRNYYPYTIERLEKLCRMAGFIYENCTWFYAWNKVSNIEHVGDPTLKKIIRAIRKLRLSKLAYVIAEKVSVILFICEKQTY
ncbi:MAG: class I SAM-dependent methyltransferase [Candidatus Bathyarchaeota archaeon]|nr:class I SAM-dependent methyltransferase [Candidatus Bathyarchaeota archaeon]MDH5745850.1 class I SAM-dependent methyltransferase [Candidatus Bathyarchaeota archaeon]